MDGGDDDDLVREVGLLERYHVTRHALGFDSGIALAARYISSLPLDEANLFPALSHAIRKHGELCVKIARESSAKPVFQRLTSLDFRQIVRFAPRDTTWAAVAETFQDEFLQRFDTSSTLPLWRLVVLGDNTVVLFLHHAIGDGMSTMAFHRALLTALNDNRLVPPPQILEPTPVPPTISLGVPVEQGTNLWPSLITIAKVLFTLFAPRSWTKGASAWTGNVVNLNAEPLLATRVRLIDIPPADAARLHRLCKANHTTFTGIVHALAASSLSHTILSDPEWSNNNAYKTICTLIPISLRTTTGTSPNAICDHVSTEKQYPPLMAAGSPQRMWTDAERCTARLRAVDSRGEIGLLRLLFGQYEAFFTGAVGKKRTAGLELSNIGRAVGFEDPASSKSSGAWSVDKMAFAQADPIGGAAVKLNLVGTPEGGLIATVTWSETAVSSKLVDLFIDRFHEELNMIVNDSAKA